jgi:hypothetical protein
MYTIIGTNTRSNHCRRHGWPSLYSFEGKMIQSTKCHVPIVNSKMDFSRQIWEQQWQVFLQCTQCSDPRETGPTWWGGEGFPGATRVLVGGAMVMINFHIELCVESYTFHFGTRLGKRHLSPNWYQDETHRKCCRWDIFQVADVSCLENIVSDAGRPVFESKFVQENDPFAWCWKIKTMRFDIGRLQIHTIWLRPSDFPT